ncbi:MAG: glycosyltransferase [archaeon]
MKILYLCPRFPTSRTRGDAVRIYQQLEALKDHEVTFVSFDDGEVKPEHINNLKKFCKEVYLAPLPKERRGVVTSTLSLNQIKLGIKFLFSSLPLQVNFYLHESMVKLLQELNRKEKFDVLWVCLERMAEYAKYVDAKVKVLDYIDSLSLNVFRRMKTEKNILWKIYCFIDYPRLSTYEKKQAEVFDELISISSIDKKHIGSRKITVIPTAINFAEFNDPKYENITGEKGRIIFLGRMDYAPNISAVLWFAKKIFPLIKKEVDYAKFYIVGANPPDKVKNLANNRDIFVAGFVKDRVAELYKSEVAVAPLRISSGIQMKVLEALAAKLPVVCTPQVAEPIRLSEKEGVFVGDTEEEIAKKIVYLLKNKVKFSNRKLRENFSKEAVLKKYYDLLKQIEKEVKHGE